MRSICDKMLRLLMILTTLQASAIAFPTTQQPVTTRLPLMPENATINYANITIAENETGTDFPATTMVPITITRMRSKVEIQIDALRKEMESLKFKYSVPSMYCEFLPGNICGECHCVDERRLPQKYYCDCRNLTPQRDCLEFRQNNYKTSGVYMVKAENYKPIQVYCDQKTDGGGWTVFQRRFDGTETFHRDWEMYKLGFGDFQFEHWLGNENIFKLLLHGEYYSGNELRVDLMDWDRKPKHAYYGNFQVGNEFTHYQLHVGGYNGTAGDSFQGHNKMDFTTVDQDHDLWAGGNCAQKYFGGWWYTGTSCTGGVTLNGHYYELGEAVTSWTGIGWPKMCNYAHSLKRTEMKFRRKA